MSEHLGLIPADATEQEIDRFFAALEDEECDCARLRRAKHELEAEAERLRAQVAFLRWVIADQAEGRA